VSTSHQFYLEYFDYLDLLDIMPPKPIKFYGLRRGGKGGAKGRGKGMLQTPGEKEQRSGQQVEDMDSDGDQDSSEPEPQHISLPKKARKTNKQPEPIASTSTSATSTSASNKASATLDSPAKDTSSREKVPSPERQTSSSSEESGKFPKKMQLFCCYNVVIMVSIALLLSSSLSSAKYVFFGVLFCFVILEFGDVVDGADGDESEHTATGAMGAAKKKSKSAPKKAADPKKAVEPKKTTGKGKKGKRAEDTTYNFTEEQEVALAVWLQGKVCLYNKKCRGYKDIATKLATWKEKAPEFGCTGK